MPFDILETKNLILRKAKASDLESIHNNVWSQDILAEKMLWVPTHDIEQSQERLNRTIAYQSTHFAYFICLKETNEAIGFAGIIEVEKDIYEDTGFCIAKEYQGKGYGKEMLSCLLKLVFEDLKGQKFLYSCFSTNEASRNLCLSQGFKYVDSVNKIREHDKLEYVSENYYMDREMYFS